MVLSGYVFFWFFKWLMLAEALWLQLIPQAFEELLVIYILNLPVLSFCKCSSARYQIPPGLTFEFKTQDISLA